MLGHEGKERGVSLSRPYPGFFRVMAATGGTAVSRFYIDCSVEHTRDALGSPSRRSITGIYPRRIEDIARRVAVVST